MRPHPLLEPNRGSVLILWDAVGVVVPRCLNTGVAEALAHPCNCLAFREKKGRHRVPQIVERVAAEVESGLLGSFPQCHRKRAAVEILPS